MNRIVVIRFSALGDVVLTIPVLASLIKQYPQTELIFVTKKGYGNLFSMFEGKIRIVEADFQGKNKGILGVFRLFAKIVKYKPNCVADLHSVLRTWILNLLFIIWGIKTFRIQKGRTEKRKLVRRKNKIQKPLHSTLERYQDVFKRLGLDFKIDKNFKFKIDNPLTFEEIKGFEGKVIGIAPFAKHGTKTYPIEKMEEVIRLLSQKYLLILFGGGINEIKLLKELENKFENVISVVGKFSLNEELQLMSKLSAILTMDSANMHLASLVGIPVVSVWGATHRFAGFAAWNQPETNMIELNLPCRPCSIYGNKDCWRGDLACMHGISPETIVAKLKECAR